MREEELEIRRSVLSLPPGIRVSCPAAFVDPVVKAAVASPQSSRPADAAESGGLARLQTRSVALRCLRCLRSGSCCGPTMTHANPIEFVGHWWFRRPKRPAGSRRDAVEAWAESLQSSLPMSSDS